MNYLKMRAAICSIVAFLFLTGFVGFFSKPIIAATNTITLVGTIETKKSFQGRWLELIYTEAFKRLGFTLIYKDYPAKRASMLSDTGQVDGEIHRVFSYSDKHPNMMRVAEPHFTINFSAFAKKPGIKLNGWQSLKGKEYRVDYRFGVKKTESQLPKVVPPKQLKYVTHILAGLKNIANGRTDIYIDVEDVIKSVINKNAEIKSAGLYRAGIMDQVSVHAFLHRKHQNIVPKLEKILKEMKREGLIKKYKKIALSE